MHLAKPRMDVGLFTNNLEPLLDFWQRQVELPFDHVLPVARGWKQHRHDLLGSVLKINHFREALPDHPTSGYRELLIARAGLREPRPLADPDGNRITLVPPGTSSVTRIGIKLGVRDSAAHRRFYTEALGLPVIPEAAGNAFLAGDSVILIEQHADAPTDTNLQGPGYRYLTFQVFNTDEEHARVLAHRGREGQAPRTMGSVARISMIRDPDGNWIELSQRASLTGSLA